MTFHCNNGHPAEFLCEAYYNDDEFDWFVTTLGCDICGTVDVQSEPERLPE